MFESTLTYHELESLDMHEKLSLVVISSTCIDGSITNLRLERIRMPQFDRIDRLNVIMTIDEHCRKRRIYHLLSEDHRMSCCRIYCSLICSCLHKKLNKTLSTALHIRFMLLQ